MVVCKRFKTGGMNGTKGKILEFLMRVKEISVYDREPAISNKDLDELIENVKGRAMK